MSSEVRAPRSSEEQIHGCIGRLGERGCVSARERQGRSAPCPGPPTAHLCFSALCNPTIKKNHKLKLEAYIFFLKTEHFNSSYDGAEINRPFQASGKKANQLRDIERNETSMSRTENGLAPLDNLFSRAGEAALK